MANLQFLLIQDGKVIDSVYDPTHLNIADLDAFADFKVAIGYTNQDGEREILGIAADVATLAGCVTWRITSNQDGNGRLINSAGCPARLVRRRLRVMFTQGWFDDLCQLPLPVTLVPGERAAKLVAQ